MSPKDALLHRSMPINDKISTEETAPIHISLEGPLLELPAIEIVEMYDPAKLSDIFQSSKRISLRRFRLNLRNEMQQLLSTQALLTRLVESNISLTVADTPIEKVFEIGTSFEILSAYSENLEDLSTIIVNQDAELRRYKSLIQDVSELTARCEASLNLVSNTIDA